MSKHTPGPWPIVRGKNGRTILQIGKCTADEYAGAVWLEVTEPDASLIAAAPDLLEALESVKQCGFDNEDGSGWGEIHITRGDWNIVLAAIAKARGES